jgi:hyperosmotically inducible protein
MNKISLFIALMIISTMIACSDSKQTSKDNTSSPTTTSPDNTANNEKDRNTQNPSPLDQQENSTDLDITQKIRQSVIDDKDLSVNAKNVKIITENSSVTLRGVVNSNNEKRQVETLAKQVAGVRNVDNQLEVIQTTTDTSKDR